MEKPVIYIDPQRAHDLDREIVKAKRIEQPIINISPQRARDLDREIVLQKLYYQPEGYYQNAERLRNACIKAGYNFSLATIKKWLEPQKMYQIYRPLPKNAPYASYSRISKPNCVHQCDLIEIPYDEDNSSEVADAFRNIYKNPNNYLLYPRWLQYNEGREFIGSVTLLMDKHNVKIRRIKARFRNTSLAIVDRYAGFFTLRVFKNQYAIEFLLPTSKRCRECERFARRI
ncbi:11139_t:CDS:2, partial [Gigaspora rosea]